MSFFPYFKILPIDANIQPFCGLVAFAMLSVYGFVLDNSARMLLGFLVVLLGYTLVAVVLGFSFSAIIQNFAYLMPILTYTALKDNLDRVSGRAILACIKIYLVTGILQTVGILGPIASALHFDALIPGFSGTSLGSVRGVTFVASEPSYASYIIFEMLAVALCFYHRGVLTSKQMRFAAYAVGAMVLMNKSSTGMVLMLTFAAGYGLHLFMLIEPKRRTRLFLSGLATTIIGVPLLIFLVALLADKVRFLETLRVLTSVELWQAGWQNALALIGGKRFVTVYVGYASMFVNAGFGHGIGSYQSVFSEVSKQVGVDFSTLTALMEGERNATALKPDAYGAAIALDTGWMGLVALGLFLRSVIRGRRGALPADTKVAAIRSGLFVAAVFQILMDTPTSIPVAWVVLALVYAGFTGPSAEHTPSSAGLAQS
jgi:hypothetical protein